MLESCQAFGKGRSGYVEPEASHLTSPMMWILFSLVLVLVLGLGPVQSQTSNMFERIKQVQKRHEDALFEISGVNAVGIGKEGQEYVLHVYVNEEVNPTPGRDVPDQLEGVRVVVIKEKGEFWALTALPLDNGPEHRQTFPPPVPMGVSTSNDLLCAAGTLGFRAQDPNTGQVGYITNNHVAVAGSGLGCPNSAPIGTDQLQAGVLDSGCNTPATDIGDLDRFIPIQFGLFSSNLVDAAFVASSTGLISNSILDIGPPVGTARDPVLAEFVQKSGRTTSLTTGQVRSVNATVRINYGIIPGLCGSARFLGQVAIVDVFGPFGRGGDSGSPVLSLSGEPVGLLFGGRVFRCARFRRTWRCFGGRVWSRGRARRCG